MALFVLGAALAGCAEKESETMDAEPAMEDMATAATEGAESAGDPADEASDDAADAAMSDTDADTPGGTDDGDGPVEAAAE